jgi:hypothetical protein
MPHPQRPLEALAPPVFTRDRRLHIASTKYDGSLHYQYDAYLVDITGPLIRCWVDIGTPWISYRGSGITRHQETVLFFTDRWYNVRHNHETNAARFEIYANIALPARLEVGTIHWVDLDIDLIRDARGVTIDDEDEFADHRVRMSYPEEVVAQVLEATAEATRLLHQNAFPFDRETHIP